MVTLKPSWIILVVAAAAVSDVAVSAYEFEDGVTGVLGSTEQSTAGAASESGALAGHGLVQRGMGLIVRPTSVNWLQLATVIFLALISLAGAGGVLSKKAASAASARSRSGGVASSSALGIQRSVRLRRFDAGAGQHVSGTAESASLLGLQRGTSMQRVFLDDEDAGAGQHVSGTAESASLLGLQRGTSMQRVFSDDEGSYDTQLPPQENDIRSDGQRAVKLAQRTYHEGQHPRPAATEDRLRLQRGFKLSKAMKAFEEDPYDGINDVGKAPDPQGAKSSVPKRGSDAGIGAALLRGGGKQVRGAPLPLGLQRGTTLQRKRQAYLTEEE